MKEIQKLTYTGEPFSFHTISTRRRIAVNDGDVIEVSSEELKEIKKARFSNKFKELIKKPKKEAV